MSVVTVFRSAPDIAAQFTPEDSAIHIVNDLGPLVVNLPMELYHRAVTETATIASIGPTYPEDYIKALSARYIHDDIFVLYADTDTPGAHYGYGVYRAGERVVGGDDTLGTLTPAAREMTARVFAVAR